MSLIDTTYFQDDSKGIYIPSVVAPNVENKTELETFITKYEKQVLINALGFELYTNFMANLSDGDKYQDILDGKTYSKTICGKTVDVRWNGLANTDKESLIAYYTYFFWMQQKSTSNSLAGVVGNLNENSEQATPRTKMVIAWNNFYKLYQGDPNDTNVSLGQFIYDVNKETPNTYENWIFKNEARLNLLMD